MVKPIAVVSSNINRIGYDVDGLKLYVEFKSSKCYVYEGVPLSVFVGFKQADSKGSYFSRNVKNKFSTLLMSVNPFEGIGLIKSMKVFEVEPEAIDLSDQGASFGW